MAMCCNLLLPLRSRPSLFSAKAGIKFRGSNTPRLQQSAEKEIVDQHAYNIRNARVHNYHYESKKKLKCVSIEVPQVEDSGRMNTSKSLMDSLKIFYTFTRAYSCIGTISIILSSSLIAIERLSNISWPFLIGVTEVTVAFCCLMVYVNGVNQVFDIEIDKINKPYLPLASGEMTVETGSLIISCFALMAFAVGLITGSMPLLWGIFISFILLSMYSVKLPFLRWKRSAIATAYIIFVCYGIVFPVTSYFHMQVHAFGRQANFPRSLVFGTISLSLFFIVIALFKDIPDIEGDRKHGIRSLATIVGPKKVFWSCVSLLMVGYMFAIIFGATSSNTWSKLITISSHVILPLILWKHAKSLDIKDESAIASFYMFIWKLIYAECLLIPLVR